METKAAETRNAGIVTIPSAEYELFPAQSERISALEKQVELLTGALRLSRHKWFGASSERVSEEDMDQLSLLFNEAVVYADKTPKAVAHIATQKFVMGSPLYRQEQELNRQGVPLKRQTMSNWLVWVSKHLLTPVYDQLHKELLTRDVLHADETTLQMLREPGKTPQSKNYMWLYRTSGDTDRPIVLYEYQPDRKGEHPKEFLSGFRGYLHTDGYLSFSAGNAIHFSSFSRFVLACPALPFPIPPG